MVGTDVYVTKIILLDTRSYKFTAIFCFSSIALTTQKVCKSPYPYPYPGIWYQDLQLHLKRETEVFEWRRGFASSCALDLFGS